ERVDDPAIRRTPAALALLLAEDGMIGEATCDAGPHRRLRLAVGTRDRGPVGLQLDAASRVEVGERAPPALARHLDRDREELPQPGLAHARSIPRRTYGRSPPWRWYSTSSGVSTRAITWNSRRAPSTPVTRTVSRFPGASPSSMPGTSYVSPPVSPTASP